MTKHPIFSNSVRVFFPLAAIIAVIVPMWTTSILNNNYPFTHSYFSAFQWHAYEMLFGFLLTLLTGFIFTAGGYWSGKGPIEGRPLILLLLAWIIDQVSIYLPVPGIVLLPLGLVFPLYFLKLLINLLDGYAQKGKFVFLFSFILILKTTFLLSEPLGYKPSYTFLTSLSLWAYTYFAFLIATRLTPRFTQTFFKFENKIKTPAGLLVTTELSIISLILAAFNFVPDTFSGFLYIFAAVLSFVQLTHWRTLTAIRKPVIGLLHIGYLLFILSLFVAAAGKLFPIFGILKSDTHLLLTGGIAFIAMNIMVRSSLGHTGRKIEMTPTIYAIFACLIIGALLRTFVPIIFPSYAIKSLHHSMGTWTLGYIIFLVKFVPMLVRRRADGK